MSDSMSEPFAPLTENDHGPLIIVATWILYIVSCIAAGVKFWTRYEAGMTLAATDWVMLSGIILSFLQSVILTVAVNHGLGRRAIELTADQIDAAGKAFYAANMLSLPVLACAKCSVILLMLSIQPGRTFMLSSYAVVGTIGAWCVAGILAQAFQCQLPTPWVFGGTDAETCIDQFALRTSLGVVDILTDIAVVVLSYAMTYGVRVDLARKLTIVGLFGLRLTIPPFVIVALTTWHTYYTSDPGERAWNSVAPSIWSQVTLALSLITACIPSIKKFLSEVQSGLMGATISETYDMTHSGGKATQLRSGTGNRSRLGGKYGILRSKSQRMSAAERSQLESVAVYDNGGGSMARVRGGARQGSGQDTESVKGLTQNTILQRVDVDVEFEESSEGRLSR